jgi:hypothetical protein
MIFQTPQPWGPGCHIYIPRDIEAQLYRQVFIPLSPPPATERVEGEVEVMTQPTVSRQACLSFGHPSGTRDQIFISVRFTGFLCWAPFLTIGWAFCLQLLLGLASAVILGPESRWSHDHILLSQMWDSANQEYLVPAFINLPRTGWPSYTPGQRRNQTYLMTDGQLASLAWYQATIWDPRPIFFLIHGICIQRAAEFHPYYGTPSLRGPVCSLFSHGL